MNGLEEEDEGGERWGALPAFCSCRDAATRVGGGSTWERGSAEVRGHWVAAKPREYAGEGGSCSCRQGMGTLEADDGAGLASPPPVR